MSVSSITRNTATVSWNASSDNVGVVGYVFIRTIDIFNITTVDTVTSTFISLTDLTPSTGYTVRVEALDASGNKSAASTPLRFTTVNAVSLKIGGVNVSNITRSGATVSWNPLSSNSGAVGYTILLNGNSIGSSSTTDTFFNITGLSVNTDYSVSIVAFDGIGNQMASSTEVSFTTLNSVGVPTAICTNVDGIAERPLPYTEGFESGVDWKQSNNDDGDWKLATSFSTPSAAAEGKRYLILRYIENNGTAIIRTPCIDLTDKSDASFTFQYQLYGNDIGNLVLQVDDGTGWVDYWSQSGDQGNI